MGLSLVSLASSRPAVHRGVVRSPGHCNVPVNDGLGEIVFPEIKTKFVLVCQPPVQLARPPVLCGEEGCLHLENTCSLSNDCKPYQHWGDVRCMPALTSYSSSRAGQYVLAVKAILLCLMR